MARRVLLAAAIVLSLAIAAGLTLAISDCASTPRRYHDQPQPPGDSITVKLAVSPAAAPDPALKYELLPRLHEKAPGNAADGYNRVFLPMEEKARDEGNARYSRLVTHGRLLAAPRDEFPADEARQLVTQQAEQLRVIEKAALSEYCNWNLLTRLRADGINTLLPEIQPAREVAHLLALRSRLELIDGKIDESIRTLRTVFQIAKHVSEGETHLHALAGVAIGTHAFGRVEEVIQQPDAPNLYWALSGLPRPFTDPASAFAGDEISIRVMFPIIDKFEGKPVSAAEADEAVAQFFTDLGKRGGEDGNPVEGLVAALGLEVIINRQHETAKKELVARGRPAKEVEAMPAKQAVFLASWERHKSLRDGVAKWYRQPYPEALAGFERVREQFNQAKEDAIENKDVFGLPLIMMTPEFQKSFEAHVRFERHLAVLRAVEALRLHAAANGGKWPAKLEEVKAVAVPDDPVTGKPFDYVLKGDTAILSGPTIGTDPPTRWNTIRYEMTLRPAK